MPHTIKDIARLAGVSTATVSRVVNGFEKVSDETRARVLALISEARYHPNAHAIELVRGRRENSKLCVMMGASGAEIEVRRNYRRRTSQAQGKQVDLLKKENMELRNLIGNLYRQIARWQRERQGETLLWTARVKVDS